MTTATLASPDFRVKKFENNRFMSISPHEKGGGTIQRVFYLYDIAPFAALPVKVSSAKSNEEEIIEVLRKVSDMKIGEFGSYWYKDDNMSGKKLYQPIDYKYAKIKLGDVFDFYTDSDGVLKFPPWNSFKFVVDQYLEEDPRIKYHPSRVRQFIDENGIDQLEFMQ